MWKWIVQLLRLDHKHDIFISYAKEDTDIVENLRGQFRIYGIKAWVYSKDSIITEEVWHEIESKIIESGLFLYIASKFSNNAAGQQNVSISLDFESDKQLELDIPKEYKVFTMFQMMLTGWDIYMKNIDGE